MQRLHESGISLHGQQWPIFRERQFQPHGYWECGDAINGDISRVADGQAVKVHPYKLHKIDLSKCVVLTPLRAITDIVASQIKFGLSSTTESVQDEYERTEKVRTVTPTFTSLVEGTYANLLR